MSTTHTHVLDPDFSTKPIPWAPEADAEAVPLLYSACLDDCEDCVTELVEKAAKNASTTAVIISVATDLGVREAAMAVIRRHFDLYSPMRLLLEGAVTEGAVPGSERLLAMTGALSEDERFERLAECAQIVHLYTTTLKPTEP